MAGKTRQSPEEPVHGKGVKKGKSATLKKGKELNWRISKMREWRRFRKLKLSGVAETLSDPPYSLPSDHVKIGRYERGENPPDANYLEALAKLYGTDIDSMLNRTPGKTYPHATDTTASAIIELWDEADIETRQFIIGFAHRVVRPGLLLRDIEVGPGDQRPQTEQQHAPDPE